MRAESTERRPLSDALGLPCALISLGSGVIGLAMAVVLWWRVLPHNLDVLGDNAGLFSAAIGLALAGIGLSSKRKRVRRVAIAALIVNGVILGFILDNIFLIFH